ncbi:hypothetical protein MF672_038130 [Actinomadura sp. ATCC 31491]|uniref:Uncharacterized protein n=1 Tax=Actinomadura luzonensis TaxID=2805427 RepID=A0ABT0G4P7_9ACTN|nr:hypothetical protein [Actinomadura luzonensis]MCK2219572.1 hypothetical protein [Actinomadura luzonensis]
MWIPLLVAVGYSLGQVAWPPLFTAALGRLTHLALARALFPSRRPAPLSRRSGPG